jgi:hypothetical protein
MYAQAGIPERLKSADEAQLASAPKKGDRPAPTRDPIFEPQCSASQSGRPWGANNGESNPHSKSAKAARRRKGRKVGKPRGKTCRWTAELDEVLKTAWAQGGLRTARRALRQREPTWSRYSIKKRAATLGLCRRRAPRWTDADENHLLWSIDSNASLALIAERLGRTVAAVRKRLRDLQYTAESLGGFKVKDVADMFGVPPARVQYWVAEKLLLTKGGRITDSSVSKFLADHPEKIPFESLSVDMQNWLREMGYPDRTAKQKAAGVDNE